MTDPNTPPRIGFYETFRTSGGRPHHWHYNRRRLQQACARAGISVPPSFLLTDDARLGAAVRQLLHDYDANDAVFRYTIVADDLSAVPPAFRGGTHAGVNEELTARPLPLAPPPEGIALRVLNLARTPSASPSQPRPKSLHDPDLHAASQEVHARAVASSDEGLFLSRDDRCVVETARQSVFWVSGDTLHFPDPTLGAIASTGLAWVLERCGSAKPARASLETLLVADAVAVCNAVRGVTPVREIWDVADRAPLGTFASAQHPLVAALTAAWHAALVATSASESNFA